MEEKIVLDELIPLQKELDDEIAKNHNVTYESTFDRRLLALLVELGEFANETRCFKYWSLKGPNTKEIILDEFADGMHFFISLGIHLGVERFTHTFKVREKDLTKQIILCYKQIAVLHENFTPEQYGAAFGDFLNILPLFGFEGSEAIAAYKKKMEVNHKRQETKY